jgi:hypothetical protein
VRVEERVGAVVATSTGWLALVGLVLVVVTDRPAAAAVGFVGGLAEGVGGGVLRGFIERLLECLIFRMIEGLVGLGSG